MTFSKPTERTACPNCGRGGVVVYVTFRYRHGLYTEYTCSVCMFNPKPVTLEEVHKLFRQAQQDHVADRTRLMSHLGWLTEALEQINQVARAAIEQAKGDV